MILAISSLVLTSCTTYPKSLDNSVTPKFPDPVDENGNFIVTLEGDSVSMPLWYWLKITSYAIDVDAYCKIDSVNSE